MLAVTLVCHRALWPGEGTACVKAGMVEEGSLERTKDTPLTPGPQKFQGCLRASCQEHYFLLCHNITVILPRRTKVHRSRKDVAFIHKLPQCLALSRLAKTVIAVIITLYSGDE